MHHPCLESLGSQMLITPSAFTPVKPNSTVQLTLNIASRELTEQKQRKGKGLLKCVNLKHMQMWD